MRMISFEIVIVCVDLHEKAIRQNKHASENSKDGISHCFVNDGEVCNIGSIGKIELEFWRVDESDLCSADLLSVSITKASSCEEN